MTDAQNPMRTSQFEWNTARLVTHSMNWNISIIEAPDRSNVGNPIFRLSVASDARDYEILIKLRNTMILIWLHVDTKKRRFCRNNNFVQGDFHQQQRIGRYSDVWHRIWKRIRRYALTLLERVFFHANNSCHLMWCQFWHDLDVSRADLSFDLIFDGEACGLCQSHYPQHPPDWAIRPPVVATLHYVNAATK